MGTKITALPTDAAPEGGDLIPFVDVSVNRTEATTIQNLATSISPLINIGYTSTTSALTAAANKVNTDGKYIGRAVFNVTTSQPLWAQGTSPLDPWVDATGTVALTPV